MHNRLDDLLLAFILLSIPLIQGIDHFVEETPVSQFVTGVLIGLAIASGLVYVYRISSQSTQKR